MRRQRIWKRLTSVGLVCAIAAANLSAASMAEELAGVSETYAAVETGTEISIETEAQIQAEPETEVSLQAAPEQETLVHPQLQYRLEPDYPDGCDLLLPDEQMEIRTNLWKSVLDEETGEYGQEEIVTDGYTVQIKEGFSSDIVTATVTEEEPAYVYVTVKEHADSGEAWIPVVALAGDAVVAEEMFHVYVTDCYYVLKPAVWNDGMEQGNLNVGETLDLTPQLIEVAQGKEEVRTDITSNEDIFFRWEIDENNSAAWELGDQTGKGPGSLTRAGSQGTEVCLAAYRENPEDMAEPERLADRYYWFDEIMYDAYLDYSYGYPEDSRVYTDKPLRLTLGTYQEEMMLPEEAEVKWSVSGDCVTAKEGVDESGAPYMELQGSAGREGESALAEARILYGGQEIAYASAQVWVHSPQLDIYLSGDTALLPRWYHVVPAMADGWIQDADHFDGEGFSVEVKNLSVDGDPDVVNFGENENGDVIYTPRQDENGNWVMWGDRYGCAQVELTYEYTIPGSNEPKEGAHSFGICVGGDVYDLRTDYPNDCDCVFPGSTMDIYTSLYREYYDADQDMHGSEQIGGYTLEIGEYDRNLLKSVSVETNSETGDPFIRIIAADGENWGDVWIPVRAIVNGAEVWAQDIHAVVTDTYYTLAVEWNDGIQKDDLNLGETVDIAPHLYEFSAATGARRELTQEDGIFFRLEDVDENAWTQGGTNTFGIPVLTRKGQWDTNFRLAAYRENPEDEENPEYLADYTCFFNELQFEPDFAYSYGSRENSRLYTDGSKLELALTTSVPVTDEGFAVNWEVLDEGGENPADYVTYTQSKEDQCVCSVEAAADSGAAGRGIRVRATIQYDGNPVDVTETWIEICDPVYRLDMFSEELGLLPDDWVEFPERQDVFIQDSEFPDGIRRPAVLKSVDSNDESIVTTAYKDGAWRVEAVSGGTATLTVAVEELTSAVKDKEKEIYIQVDVCDEFFQMDVWTEGSAQSGCMLPDDTLQLKTEVRRVFRDQETGEVQFETIENYQVGYENYDSYLLEVTDKGEVTARYGRRGGTEIQITAKDENGDILTERWIHIEVTGRYYVTEYSGEPIILEPEQEFVPVSLRTKEVSTTYGEREPDTNIQYLSLIHI